jgi:hypothetical protein
MKKHTKKCREKWEPMPGGYYCPVHDDFIDQEDEFTDDMKKIFANEGKTCEDCKHYDGVHHCPAFPLGIPEPYWLGREVHKKPGKYRQKNKIVFEPKIIKCPKCKSENVVKIVYGYPMPSVMRRVYGYPMPSVMRRAEKGLVELGGCVVGKNDPTHHCKDCKKNFRSVAQ